MTLNRPVIGWRCWAVDHEGVLHAQSEAYGWVRRAEPTWANPERAVAYCGIRRVRGMCHARWSCSCGLHAFYAPRDRWPGGLMPGAVIAWGRVVLHESGFRAEYARPVGFLEQAWAHPNAWMERAADRYGDAGAPGWGARAVRRLVR